MGYNRVFEAQFSCSDQVWYGIFSTWRLPRNRVSKTRFISQPFKNQVKCFTNQVLSHCSLFSFFLFTILPLSSLTWSAILFFFFLNLGLQTACRWWWWWIQVVVVADRWFWWVGGWVGFDGYWPMVLMGGWLGRFWWLLIDGVADRWFWWEGG